MDNDHSLFDLDMPAAPPVSEVLTDAERREVSRLLRGIPRKNRVRAVVENLLTGQAMDENERLRTIVLALERGSGFRWREARLAAWTASRIPAPLSEKQCLATALSVSLKTRKWKDHVKQYLAWTGALAAVFIAIGVSMQILSLSGFSLAEMLFTVLFSILLSIPFMAPFYYTITDLQLNRVREAAAVSLGRLGLTEGASELAAAIHNRVYDDGRSRYGIKRVQKAAKAALPDTLAPLTPQHYMAIHPDTVANLCILLENRDETLAAMALEALGKIGDGRAVLPVQRIADKSKSHDLKRIAVSILPILQQRREQENAYGNLLRASSAPVTPAGMLLRPAMPAASAGNPETLLRAHQPPEND